MRIAVDVRALQLGSEYRGIGAYLLNLLRRMPVADGPHRFSFLRYDDSDPLLSLRLPPGSYDEILLDRPDESGGGRAAAWRRRYQEAFLNDFGDVAHRDLDVFWQPDFHQGVPSLPGTRVVVTMYDLIPLVMPEAYLPSRRERLRRDGRSLRLAARYFVSGEVWDRKYRRCLDQVDRADTVLSISEATSRDLQRFLGLDPTRIATIPLGAPAAPAAGAGTADESVADLEGREFLLFIGGVDHRRRLDHLVGAFDELRRRGRELDLVLVGYDFTIMNDIHHLEGRRALAASPYAGDIRVLGYVSDEVKHWLYRRAAAFVFPSTYEGFGLPLLEAMVERCPVITYRNSSLIEVGGDAVVFVDPPGPRPLADAVEGLLDDPARRQAMLEAGLERAKAYSWDRCAADTLEVLTARPGRGAGNGCP